MEICMAWHGGLPPEKKKKKKKQQSRPGWIRGNEAAEHIIMCGCKDPREFFISMFSTLLKSNRVKMVRRCFGGRDERRAGLLVDLRGELVSFERCIDVARGLFWLLLPLLINRLAAVCLALCGFCGMFEVWIELTRQILVNKVITVEWLSCILMKSDEY